MSYYNFKKRTNYGIIFGWRKVIRRLIGRQELGTTTPPMPSHEELQRRIDNCNARIAAFKLTYW